MVSYVVTGASRGIGLGFIRQLSQDPSNVVIALVRNKTSSSELTELAATSKNLHIVVADIASLSQVQDAAKAVSSITGGGLDVLINNAALLDAYTAVLMPSQLSDPEHLDTVKQVFANMVDTNVYGAIHVTNSFLPLIEQGAQKKIVHISTGFADTDFVLETGVATFVPYSASKAMLNHVVAKYAVELRPKDIHVVAISPGFVDTSPMPRELVDMLAERFRRVDPKVTDRISVEESVRYQLETIANLGWDVQGKMISHHGNRRDWF